MYDLFFQYARIIFFSSYIVLGAQITWYPYLNIREDILAKTDLKYGDLIKSPCKILTKAFIEEENMQLYYNSSFRRIFNDMKSALLSGRLRIV